MAESKSDQFLNKINAHSEKIAKWVRNGINGIAADSECSLVQSGVPERRDGLPSFPLEEAEPRRGQKRS
jgi:hypothetical protein